LRRSAIPSQRQTDLFTAKSLDDSWSMAFASRALVLQ